MGFFRDYNQYKMAGIYRSKFFWKHTGILAWTISEKMITVRTVLEAAASILLES